jgi:hypothetical protein
MKRIAAAITVISLALVAGSAFAQPVAHSKPAQKKAADSGQPVIDWNQLLLTIVNTPGAQPATIQPTRSFAILHASIYDAVTAIDRSHEPYLIFARAPRGASETAAANAAARTALVGLYPAQQSTIDATYATELAKVADGPGKDAGVHLGVQVASDLLAIRAGDGSAVTPPPFVPGTNPGNFRPTPPNVPAAVFTTWGQVTPFVLDNGNQFRASALPRARPARAIRPRSASSGRRRSRTSGTKSPSKSPPPITATCRPPHDYSLR